ncbi:MAG TPA: endonuclease Q family protein, partial [Candidatus Hypogeohydataceae bacterium YC38]
AELKAKLEPAEGGLFRLKGPSPVRFILTAEVSNIFQQEGRLRKVHTLIFAPSFAVVDKINTNLGRLGKLSSDGRPTLTAPVKEVVKLVLDSSPDCLVIPAHAWTPWFSLFGANSGFDSIEECFQEESRHISAIETGLSSNPSMNWRLSILDPISLVSNSDAHSPPKIGREANVFQCNMDYWEITDAIKNKDKNKFLFTIEFFPEEGKYHYDGHRNCGLVFSPQETRRRKGLCPSCKRRLTIGVMHRVENLADRPEGYVPQGAIPAQHLVPLEEIIAEALNQSVNTKAVREEYLKAVHTLGNEFFVLMDAPKEDLFRCLPARVAEGIIRVRERRLRIKPGYDGVYGQVSIFDEGDKGKTSAQMELFER